MKELQHGVTGFIFNKQLKNIMRTALRLLSTELPEMNYNNLELANSRKLLDLHDEFFAHLRNENPKVRETFTVLFNFAIMLYDSDLIYREWANWMVKRIKEIDWAVEPGEEEPRIAFWKKGEVEHEEEIPLEV